MITPRTTPLARLLRWLRPPQVEDDDLRMVRPFFWLVIISLVFLYSATMVVWSEKGDFSRWLPFTALTLLHGLLHWEYPRYVGDAAHALAYYFVQGVLAFAITLLGSNLALMYGLTMSMIGEAVGFYGLKRPGWAALLFYMALSAVSFSILETPALLWTWLITTGPMAFFVVTYVALFRRQDEARQRTQQLLTELETAHRQLAEYADRVESLTIAAERQRMARELHDTLSQGLAGLILQLEACDAHLSQQRVERAQAIIRQAMERARVTLAEARLAIDDLRRDRQGFLHPQAALAGEVSRFRETCGTPCSLEGELPADLPEAVSAPLLRVVAEALSNIARHAGARQAWVRVSAQPGALRLEIGDNGAGFDAQNIPAGRYGLLGMRERVRLAGGSFALESRPGQGAIIHIHWPWNTPQSRSPQRHD